MKNFPLLISLPAIIFFNVHSLPVLQASKYVLNGNTQKLENNYYHTSGGIFNTMANFTYQSDMPLDKEIFTRLDSLDLIFNPFNTSSIIYKINRNKPAELNEWFVEMFKLAEMISLITEGKYDITASPLINLWGFGYKNMGEPSQQKIDSIMQFVGFEKIRICNNRIIKSDPRTELNASSIAKGYSVDKIAELFEKLGIKNYLIEIGGEIRLSGQGISGAPWIINIPKPSDSPIGISNELEAALGMTYGAIATSGNTTNYYKKEGKKIAHILNPVTGYPVESDILTATVIYDECSIADGFATAFIVMGLKEAISTAERIPGMRYIFLTEDKNGEIKVYRN